MRHTPVGYLIPSRNIGLEIEESLIPSFRFKGWACLIAESVWGRNIKKEKVKKYMKKEKKYYGQYINFYKLSIHKK